jgi:hypothetical protein
MGESEAKIDSNKTEKVDKPLTVWDILIGSLFMWDLKTNLIAKLILVVMALVLCFLLMILRF